jgi:hypothetical protein
MDGTTHSSTGAAPTQTFALELPAGFQPDAWWYRAAPTARAAALNSVAAFAAALEKTGAHPPDGELWARVGALELALESSRLREAAAREAGRKEAGVAKDEVISVLRDEVRCYRDEFAVSARKSAESADIVCAAFGRRAQAQKTGRCGEELTEAWFAQHLAGWTIQRVADEKMATDFLLELAETGRPPFRVLVEVKSGAEVSSADVEKFERDVRARADLVHAAMLVAIRAEHITSRGAYQLARLSGRPVAFIARALADGGDAIVHTLSLLRHAWFAFDADTGDGRRLEKVLSDAASSLRETLRAAQKAHTAAAEASGLLGSVVGSLVSMFGALSAAGTPLPELVDRRRRARPSRIIPAANTKSDKAAEGLSSVGFADAPGADRKKSDAPSAQPDLTEFLDELGV